MNRTKLGKEERRNIPVSKSPGEGESMAHSRTGREANKATKRSGRQLMQSLWALAGIFAFIVIA